MIDMTTLLNDDEDSWSGLGRFDGLGVKLGADLAAEASGSLGCVTGSRLFARRGNQVCRDARGRITTLRLLAATARSDRMVRDERVVPASLSRLSAGPEETASVVLCLGDSAARKRAD